MTILREASNRATQKAFELNGVDYRMVPQSAYEESSTYVTEVCSVFVNALVGEGIEKAIEALISAAMFGPGADLGEPRAHLRGAISAHIQTFSREQLIIAHESHMKHAQKHVEDNIGPEANRAWEHEVVYFQRHLADMRGEPQSNIGTDIIEQLKAVFGDDVTIHSLTEDVDVIELPAEHFSPSIPPSPRSDFSPTHQHIKTRGFYEKLLDVSNEADMVHYVVYQNAAGDCFSRPATEFYDIERFYPLN